MIKIRINFDYYIINGIKYECTTIDAHVYESRRHD